MNVQKQGDEQSRWSQKQKGDDVKYRTKTDWSKNKHCL